MSALAPHVADPAAPELGTGGPPPPQRTRDRVATVALLVAVALAFADASVVALALPAMYAAFDTTIVGVSWVLTTYALAIAVVAVPVALLHRRLRPAPTLAAGIVLFATASLLAGAATNLSILLVARAAQGCGATLLLAGSLPVLDAIAAGRGRRWWATAGAVGAALGPALGGTLTELLHWRAIFFSQAPLAALALLAVLHPAAPGLPADRATRTRRRARGSVALANVGFALVFAALVAALFLGVLLAIEVWRYSPLRSAALVSALPIGMLVGRLGHAAAAPTRAVAGCVLLALGLVGLAFVPGERWTFAAASFALCGAGFDLVHEVLDAAAIPPNRSFVRSGAATIGARHAGLVLGLVVIAPMLSSSIDAGIQRATLGATRTMLEAPLPLADKLPVTWHLRDAIESAPRGRVPDLAQVFDDGGAKGDNALARTRDELQTTVADAMTRSFRPAFAVAAALALLATFPAVIVAMRAAAPAPGPSRRRPRTATAVIVAAGLVGIGSLGAAAAAGALHVGQLAEQDPCTAPPDTYSGRGLDAAVQRIGLSALNGAACELHTTRERLVLSLDGRSGYGDVTWDDATLEHAMRVGADRAIDDADERNAIPGFVASILHLAADHAPLQWLVQRIDLPG
ncbi:MAG: transporter [Ilumatobacteraceae bacterium]|nr:transporter [Ilumatobacteraceae bacterium]